MESNTFTIDYICRFFIKSSQKPSIAANKKLDINTGAHIVANMKAPRKNIATNTHCLKLVIR